MTFADVETGDVESCLTPRQVDPAVGEEIFLDDDYNTGGDEEVVYVFAEGTWTQGMAPRNHIWHFRSFSGKLVLLRWMGQWVLLRFEGRESVPLPTRIPPGNTTTTTTTTMATSDRDFAELW